MSKKNTRTAASAEKTEEYPIDPKTGRPKVVPQDRKPKKQKQAKAAQQEESPDAAARLTGLPVVGPLLKMLFGFPVYAQRALWLVASGAMAWLMVQLLVITLPEIIGYTEENVLMMFTASVFTVAVAPILLTRNWHHLLRPLAVTGLAWAVYPDAMPIVLFIGLVRIFIGEIASTSLWPAADEPAEDKHAKKRS